MRQLAVFCAAPLIGCSVAFADPANILLDPDKVRSMSAEEYAAAVRSAPDVNARNENGVTPLHIAAGYGTPDKIAALVTAGADVEALDMDGWTPLYSAVAVGTPDKIAALVTAGADVEARLAVVDIDRDDALESDGPRDADSVEAEAAGAHDGKPLVFVCSGPAFFSAL